MPSLFTAAKPEERSAAAWSFAHFLLLLSSWYALRPVRDAMGIAGGVEHLPWMFTATFIGTLIAVPAFSALVSRLPIRHVVPVAYHVLALALLAFAVAPRLGLSEVALGRCFYVFATVYSLFVVSAFWSLLADAFTSEQGTRLFAPIAAGGSLGGIVGPALTVMLIDRIGTSGLLVIAAVLLAGCSVCAGRLMTWSARHGRGALAHHEQEAVGGSILGAIPPLLRNPYLAVISAVVLLYTMTSTLLYIEQAGIVRDAFATSADRAAFFAKLDLLVNAVALVMQVYLAGRLMTRLGLGIALAAVPVVTGLGFAALAAAPTLGVLAAVQVSRRALHYALDRPARETLFTVTRREERYKTKSLVDTALYRGGDALGSWAHAGVAALGAGVAAMPLVALPLVAAWIAAVPWLVRRHRHLTENPPEGSPSWNMDVATSSSSP